MTVRIIGIDLAVDAAHKAIVLDQASNEFVSRPMTFRTNPADMDRMLRVARKGAPADVPVVAVLEATAMSWFTVGVYLSQQGVIVYRVSGQQVSDLRRVYSRHAKSDRIDARVAAQLYVTHPESMYSLHLPSGRQLALQQTCRELSRLTDEIGSRKTRLKAVDKYAWLGLPESLGSFSSAARWVRENWYNPWAVIKAGPGTIIQAWMTETGCDPDQAKWVPALFTRAQHMSLLYGSPEQLDYQKLQDNMGREQRRLARAEGEAKRLRQETLRPLYRQLYPQRHLESIRGIGQDSAAVYVAFIGDVQRFPSLRQFRSWSGLIPASSQTGYSQSAGLHITQAGPNLIKRTAYINADVARQWDPQIAAIYHKQMMVYGKHHTQAVCACATHLLDRVYVVLKQDRPYELRDIDGTPVTRHQARQLCKENYHVPDEVRRRNNRRTRRHRAEQQVERRYEHKKKRRRPVASQFELTLT
jgi:transposase